MWLDVLRNYNNRKLWFNASYGSEHITARFRLVRGAKCIKLYHKNENQSSLTHRMNQLNQSKLMNHFIKWTEFA